MRGPLPRIAPTAALAVLLASSLPFVPFAGAGTQDSPEVSDEAGDQETEAGALVLMPDPFDDVDILAAWVEEDSAAATPTILLNVLAGADIQDTASFVLSFAVERGPTSLVSSTASGEAFTLEYADGEASGVDGAEGTVSGATLRVSVPRSAIGAVGGDLLTNLTVSSSRSDTGNVMDPVTQDDQSGSDEAGPGSPYTFLRAAPESGVEVEILGGSIEEGGTSSNFQGDRVNATRSDAGITVQYRVTNTGSDPDEVAVGAAGSAGIGPLPEIAATFTLAPGESKASKWEFQLDDASAFATFTLTATSQRGAQDTATLAIDVEAPAPPEERKVLPAAGLDFLTPAAEGTGLDGALGSYAELFLLGLILLLLFLLLFLLLVLRRPLPTMAAVPAPPIEPAKAFTAHVTGVPAAPSAAAAPAAATAAATAAGAQAPRGVEVDVAHDPPEPDVADKVVTTAVVRNRGREARRLRVVLSVDGKPKVEEDVEVQGRSSREVRLPWMAGPGPNQASVRVDER